MPPRTVIDMLDTVARWTDCVRHFGPRSGNEPKLDDPLDRYVRLLFAYGTNLGPTQAALHMRGAMSAYSLSYLNRRHVTAAALHAVQADIINLYDLMFRASICTMYGTASGSQEQLARPTDPLLASRTSATNALRIRPSAGQHLQA